MGVLIHMRWTKVLIQSLHLSNYNFLYSNTTQKEISPVTQRDSLGKPPLIDFTQGADWTTSAMFVL